MSNKRKLSPPRGGPPSPAEDGVARGERLQVMLTVPEVRALDTWRFQRRMPSRAAAIRELLKRGLAAEGVEVATEGTRSQDFGVLAPEAASRAEDGRRRR